MPPLERGQRSHIPGMLVFPGAFFFPSLQTCSSSDKVLSVKLFLATGLLFGSGKVTQPLYPFLKAKPRKLLICLPRSTVRKQFKILNKLFLIMTLCKIPKIADNTLYLTT